MEGSNFWLIAGAAGIFFGAIFVYVLFMVFLPEWVGITGKVALEAEKSHQGGEPAKDDFLSKLQERKQSPASTSASETSDPESEKRTDS